MLNKGRPPTTIRKCNPDTRGNNIAKEFTRIKRRFELEYKSVKEVRCPYFNEEVVFNAKGLEHLKFIRKNHARSRGDQLTRMRFFSLAVEVLKLSRTVQGITHTRHFEVQRINQRNETTLLPISYYEFIAVLHDKRVRIIVKQIAAGPKFFWSIIPFWKFDKITKRRKMGYGNPESD